MSSSSDRGGYSAGATRAQAEPQTAAEARLPDLGPGAAAPAVSPPEGKPFDPWSTTDTLGLTMALDTPSRIVVVDDDPEARETLAALLRTRCYAVETAPDGAAALALLDEDTDIVLTDLQMPILGGIELVERGRVRSPHAVFMVMTGHGEIESAVEAVKRGAEQYLTKPLQLDALLALLGPAVERAKQHRELMQLRAGGKTRQVRRVILGEHPLMQKLLKTVQQVAKSRISVLITGETGTGKELIARALHEWSGRGGSFVALNCAALAESVLESELFGHERGAFTGALQRRDGRFKQADGGTLLLDEVSEIPAAIQVKLLRFLQEREYERVGSNRTERVDVRVVAACNQDLRKLVNEGRFREDLFFRLNVIEVNVPPLRSRLSDLPALAEHGIRQACAADERTVVPRLGDAAMELMLNYRWPGNVRELGNAMERATVLCDGGEILPEHLPTLIQQPSLSQHTNLTIPGMTLAELERFAMLRTLEAVGGSRARAADILGISVRTIQYRLKEWQELGVDISEAVCSETD